MRNFAVLIVLNEANFPMFINTIHILNVGSLRTASLLDMKFIMTEYFYHIALQWYLIFKFGVGVYGYFFPVSDAVAELPSK